jgi:hypothetical protein
MILFSAGAASAPAGADKPKAQATCASGCASFPIFDLLRDETA